ncbi:putative membrane protein SirB2 [Plasticicumulans lactativorans]|uniref:Putative membrane protein SirB2 n=1 Tax=Plasticicumulans lactativorans TaxID=1133106 RepID=A0A4V2SCY7_9GAMM|nr:SirB2 family protein [Plasticicumulans lactativorans]TCO81100.1 putative membrane protein SirB2 [Plasticicumulans lactativorans]
MSYLALRHIHITAVVISIALFTLRGIWMLADSPRLQDRWVRILPHVVDTVLLASAIALTLVLGQYPFAQSWLTAKLAGLLAYIVLGAIALKRGRSKATRAAAFVAALLTVTYIVGVAVHHHPASWWWTPGG